MTKLREVNLKLGQPAAADALKRLAFEVKHSRSLGCTALKIIHGYGSTGAGGRIRVEARKSLRRMEDSGEIRGVIAGEDFSIFHEKTLHAFQRCGDLRKDPDLERHNNGMTIILL